MRLLMVAAIVFNLAEAQRSFYASRPGSFSKVLPRFRINETTTTTENALQLNVRGKEEEDEEFNFASNLPSELQGTLEDHEFVYRVSKWPEDRQPFWFKNRNAISFMRGRNRDGNDVDHIPPKIKGRPAPKFQTPFLGSSNFRPKNSFPNDSQRRRDEYFFKQLNA